MKNTETKKSLEQVLSAINGSGGIKLVIAQRLAISRPTLDRYLNRWKNAKAAYEAETEVNLDIAESIVLGNLRAAASEQKRTEGKVQVDSRDAWKFLRYKGKDRGYTDRTEITGADGGPINVDDLGSETRIDRLVAILDRARQKRDSEADPADQA